MRSQEQDSEQPAVIEPAIMEGPCARCGVHSIALLPYPGESICAQCNWTAEQAASAARRGNKARAYNRRRAYGITLAQLNAMRAKQGNACAICRTPFTKEPHVDHCHTTGKVRALLCRSCNLGLGYFKEEPARFRAAADYIEAYSAIDTSVNCR